MAYHSNDGCLGIIIILPIYLAFILVKAVLAIALSVLVIPVRLFWLLYSIPVRIFTGEDISADWEDMDFISAVWDYFFPKK